MAHIEFATLIDYLDNQVETELRTTVADHLATCADCRIALVAAQNFLDSARNRTFATPRSALTQRALAAFRQIQQRKSMRNELVANLLFDSWNLAAHSGVRGHSHERQLLYKFMDLDVDVQITPQVDARTYNIHGQILREQRELALLEGTAIRLLDEEDTSNLRQTMVDELGRFHLSHVTAGRYLLQIELADAKVRVGTLALDSR